MSTQPTPQADRPEAQGAPEVSTIDKEIQIANLKLQLVQARSNADYNSSVAGQIQRQFESMQRCAKPYAESTIVPTSYRGNLGNCIIALDLAHRMNLPALTVMQNLYIVNGNPSWSSKFLVATINTCGRFTNLRYRKRNLGQLGILKYNGLEFDPEKKRKTTVVKEFDATGIDNWECVAYAVEKETGETLESDPVTIQMAIQEGWYTKDGSKWVTMPMLMLTYRAAAFWQRAYAPEISMGFRTTEEERDVVDIEYEEIPASQPTPAAKATAATSPSVEEAKAKLRNRTATPTATASDTATNNTQSTFDMP
ncbi:MULTISPECIES: hypothetical protein [Muribaculaceae]|uniref:hypothetical protein n=1 Tax=Muribaculaceae TaxID=2005473 RepID=UPI0026474D7E|nr:MULTISPECIES: hypothetical protein [Muribaculaceae]